MPLNFKKTFGFNKDKADEGVWVDIGNDALIKVAKLGTTRYQVALMKHTRKYQSLIRLNRLDPEGMAEITANTLADSILLDWKNIAEDDNGAIMPYTRANAYRMLKDYPDFRALVEMHANDPELFQDGVTDLEADSKNSPTISNGT